MDHARAGHGAVLATAETLDFMRLRYGDRHARSTQVARYGETLSIDGITVTFRPAVKEPEPVGAWRINRGCCCKAATI